MCGILPLEFGVGRYIGCDRVDRFCAVCGLNRIEDEYHFLYSCSKLQTGRLSSIEELIVDTEQFEQLPVTKKTNSEWVLR